MNYRKLRIAWSVAWGIVAVLLVMLGVRSYWWIDHVVTQNTYQWEYYSNLGKMELAITSRDDPEFFSSEFRGKWIQRSWRNDSETNTTALGNDRTDRDFRILGFRWGTRRGNLIVAVPYWFFVSLAAMLAGLPWTRQFRWRFNLRTLLVATTLVTVGLGLIEWLTR